MKVNLIIKLQIKKEYYKDKIIIFKIQQIRIVLI